MAALKLNIRLNKQQTALIEREVESGLYASAEDVLREALRQWMERRIASDVGALEHAHAGAWDRDTTPAEEASILRIQKGVRGQLLAQRKGRRSIPPKDGRR